MERVRSDMVLSQPALSGSNKSAASKPTGGSAFCSCVEWCTVTEGAGEATVGIFGNEGGFGIAGQVIPVQSSARGAFATSSFSPLQVRSKLIRRDCQIIKFIGIGKVKEGCLRTNSLDLRQTIRKLFVASSVARSNRGLQLVRQVFVPNLPGTPD